MNKAKKRERTISNDWANKLGKDWGVDPMDILSYHSGICYDQCNVRTEDAAKKVCEYFKRTGGSVNGGMFHGMRLGMYSEEMDGSFNFKC